MARHPLDRLGKLQLAAMNVVWELGEATVGQVRDRLSREKDLAYTTVLSVMQKLERSGWPSNIAPTAGHTFICPVILAWMLGADAVREFTERAFGGNSLVLFQHLLHSERLTDSELSDLHKMLERRRKELRDG